MKAFQTTLACGTPAIVRPIAFDDASKLVKGLSRLSEQSRISRFFYNKTAFSSGELDDLTQCDGRNHLALVLGLLDSTGHECDTVAVARCIRDPHDHRLAEVAVVTVDEWQGHGIGRILIRSLADYARREEITYWKASCLIGNHAATKVLWTAGTQVSANDLGCGVRDLIFELGAS